MSDFLRKWIIGIGVTWLSFGGVCAYVLYGGPLPSADRYLEAKYFRAIANHKKLDELDAALPVELERRKELRTRWKQTVNDKQNS